MTDSPIRWATRKPKAAERNHQPVPQRPKWLAFLIRHGLARSGGLLDRTFYGGRAMTEQTDSHLEAIGRAVLEVVDEEGFMSTGGSEEPFYLCPACYAEKMYDNHAYDCPVLTHLSDTPDREEG